MEIDAHRAVGQALAQDMRLVSTPESVKCGEVSMLAIVETLTAIALVFYLSVYLNSLRWLAIAMCLSPLLLLRTEKSTELAIKWIDPWFERLPDSIPVAYPMIFLLGFVVRIGATIYSALSDPIQAAQAIPQNWAKVTLAMDSRFPPEWIPDYPRNPFAVVTKQQGLMIVFAFVFFSPLLLPAFLYRWSLKATSIIYAPLVFVAHSTFSEGGDFRTRLELIKRSDLSRIRASYGVVTIVAFLVKLVLMMKWSGFAEWWNGNPVSEFLALYVAPGEIPKWQLAEVTNSVLAVGTIFFVRESLLRYELNRPWPEKPLRRLLGLVSGLRWVLAIYTILCTGYITMREAQHWHWPPLGEKLLPWQ